MKKDEFLNEASVAITECISYDINIVFPALEKACLAAGMPNVQGKSVLLKPNILSDAKPSECITTHPSIIRAMIRLLKKQGAVKIFVGDSPGLQGPAFTAKNCGIHEVCVEEDVTWVDFCKDFSVHPIPGTKQKLPLASIIDQVDFVFSMCKFKTHQLMYSTGAVKNLFGLVPGLHKSPCHLSNPSRESFARLICGIYQLVNPAFCVMDAVIGMEGPGPANGTPRAVNLILASCNGGALDSTEALLMGYKTQSIPILKELQKRHLLPQEISYPLLNARDLVIKDFQKIKMRDKTQFIKSLVFPYFTRGFQKRHQLKEPKPLFDESLCIKCGRCVKICPGKALSLENKVIADYSKCIRCYCCHEVCPANAISIAAKERKWPKLL